MTTISNDPRLALLISAALLSLCGVSAGCSQEFSSCSETRTCSEVQGGSAGAGGTGGGSGGSSSSEAGAPSSSAGAGADGSCPGGCGDEETCCDGECVDTSSDVANCGACGHACNAGHAVAECVDSECVVERCEEGFVDCAGDDGCEAEDVGLPGVPSPFLPMVGAYTGAVGAERSLKPKFAWRAPEAAGTCGGLTYEIELTRECEPGKLDECAFEDPELREAGLESTEFTPGDALPVSDAPPVGALYAWRVRACDAPERCSEWSRVSYVNVGRLIDDINADGYSEVVLVGATGETQGMVLSGDGATPLAAKTPLGDEIGEAFGGRFLGDVNGDEFPDLLLWGFGPSDEPPRVVLGASSPESWSRAEMSGPLEVFHRGARAGDLDGDGFADVAISEFSVAGGGGIETGVVRLYRGREGFSLAGPVNFVPPDETVTAEFGAAVEGGFDADADGYPDLFILDNGGALYRVRGSSTSPPQIESSIQSSLLVPTMNRASSALVAVGDREGDGYGDLAVSLTGSTGLAILVFSGGAELATEPTASFVIESPYYETEWIGGADLGSDGRADLVVHALETVDATSRLYVLPGSTENQDAEALSNLGTYAMKLNGVLGLGHGDYDGDGTLDVTLGEPGGRRALLRGGKAAPTSEDCKQTPASFPAIGDWCSVEKSEILVPGYVGTPLR